MQNNPLVSIVIPNWNGGDVFLKCLNSLNKINYSNWELIIVDNGSLDGSEKYYLNYHRLRQKTNLICNKSNLGFAVACNQGYKISRGDFVLFLNNDTKVNKIFLSKLVDFLILNPKVAVVQPKIYLVDKPGYLDNCGSFLTVTGYLDHWGFMQKDGDEFMLPREVFSVKGACMLIRKEVILKIGLFDSDFGSYFEETDFCWRVWLFGYKVFFYPESFIYHKVGFSSKKQNQFMVNYNSNKNRICSLIKNLELKNVFFIGGLHLLLNLVLSIYYLLFLNFNKFWMIWKAVIWNVIYLKKTLIKRKQVQSIRKVYDSDIFKTILHQMSIRKMFTHFLRVEANFK